MKQFSTNPKFFMANAEAKASAKLIIEYVEDKDAFLLWKAYLKRIWPVPGDVLLAATGEMTKATALAFVALNPGVSPLTMDYIGDMLWDQLNEEQHYQWLLKVK